MFDTKSDCTSRRFFYTNTNNTNNTDNTNGVGRTQDNGILHTIEGTNTGNRGEGGRVGNRTNVIGGRPDHPTPDILIV